MASSGLLISCAMEAARRPAAASFSVRRSTSSLCFCALRSTRKMASCRSFAAASGFSAAHAQQHGQRRAVAMRAHHLPGFTGSFACSCLQNGRDVLAAIRAGGPAAEVFVRKNGFEQDRAPLQVGLRKAEQALHALVAVGDTPAQIADEQGKGRGFDEAVKALFAGPQGALGGAFHPCGSQPRPARARWRAPGGSGFPSRRSRGHRRALPRPPWPR